MATDILGNWLGMPYAMCLIMEEWFDIIYWDGEKDLIIFKALITEFVGSAPSVDDMVYGLKIGKKGMPPLRVERIIAPVFYPYHFLYSNKIRPLA